MKVIGYKCSVYDCILSTLVSTNLGPEEAEYFMQDDLVPVIEHLHVHI